MADPQVNVVLTLTDKMSSALKKSISSWTEFKSAIDVAGKAFNQVKKLYAETVGVAMDYTLSIKDMSTALGTNVEEVSALVQIGDDLRISQGVLTIAFRTLARQGIQPTIENIKQLGKEYRAIEDPAKKTQFALEKFGRAGMQLTKLLNATSEEIDGMAESAKEAGLIITDEAVVAAEEYYKSLDQLNDTMTGLKISVGTGLIPELNKLLILMNELISLDADTWFEDGAKASANFIQSFFATKAVADFADGVKEVNVPLSTMGSYATQAAIALENIGAAAENAEGQLAELKVAMQGALGKSEEDYSGKTEELNATLKDLEIQAQNIQNLGPILPPDQAQKLSEINGQIDEVKAKLAEESTAFQDNTKQILFSLLERELAVDGWTQGEIDALLKVAEKWGLIDEETSAAMKNVQGAVDAFNAGGSLDTMLADLQAIYDQIMKINNTTVQPGVGTIPNLGGGGGGGAGGGGGDTGIGTPEHPGFQHGGSMVVPPGYPNDTYPLRVSSGETVTVTPAAHKGAPTVVNIYQTFNDEGAAALGMAMTRKLATGRLNNSMGR